MTVPPGRKLRSLAYKTLCSAILYIISVIMILPFIWMISTSLKPSSDVFNYPIEWIPRRIDLGHHIAVWTGPDTLLRYYYNTLKVTLIPMAIGLIVGSMAAYSFTKLRFKGRDSLFLMYVAMMMIPSQILFVPKFLMFDFFGIYNTHWALILPHSFSVTAIFLMRQYFLSIPIEYSEASIVDGAGHLRIWAQIILPLAKPVLATVSILSYTWYWNDYQNPLIFLSSQKLFTLPLITSKYVLEDSINYNGMMAVAFAGIIPIILVFLFFQKYVINSVANAGVKG